MATLAALAREAGLNPKTVQGWRRRGKLPAEPTVSDLQTARDRRRKPEITIRRTGPLPEGSLVPMGRVYVYDPGPHPFGSYLRVAIASARRRHSLFATARDLGLVEDYFQEARLAAIETWRSGEPPLKAAEAARRRLRHLIANHGVRRDRSKG